MKVVLKPNEKWLHLIVSKECKDQIQNLAKLNKMTQANVVEELVRKTQELVETKEK